MFTGIITDIGTVEDLNEDILAVSFNNKIYSNLDLGTSIAIDGCCLTLKEYRDGNLVFQVSNETFTRTALNNNHCGFVNLELPATLDSFLSGHIVQGHVDSTINIHEINELENNLFVMTSGPVPPNPSELVLSEKVKELFKSPKFGLIAGSMVTDGSIMANKLVRVLRDNIVIHEGKLDSLRRFKDEASEVKSGTECGIGITNYTDAKVGDVIEVYEREEIARKLES